jgi:hypothetical protein
MLATGAITPCRSTGARSVATCGAADDAAAGMLDAIAVFAVLTNAAAIATTATTGVTRRTWRRTTGRGSYGVDADRCRCMQTPCRTTSVRAPLV